VPRKIEFPGSLDQPPACLDLGRQITILVLLSQLEQVLRESNAFITAVSLVREEFDSNVTAMNNMKCVDHVVIRGPVSVFFVRVATMLSGREFTEKRQRTILQLAGVGMNAPAVSFKWRQLLARVAKPASYCCFLVRIGYQKILLGR